MRVHIAGRKRVIVQQALPAQTRGQTQARGDRRRRIRSTCTGRLHHRLHQRGQGVDCGGARRRSHHRRIGHTGINVETTGHNDGATRSSLRNEKVAAFVSDTYPEISIGVTVIAGIGATTRLVNVDRAAAYITVRGNPTGNTEGRGIIARRILSDQNIVTSSQVAIRHFNGVTRIKGACQRQRQHGAADRDTTHYVCNPAGGHSKVGRNTDICCVKRFAVRQVDRVNTGAGSTTVGRNTGQCRRHRINANIERVCRARIPRHICRRRRQGLDALVHRRNVCVRQRITPRPDTVRRHRADVTAQAQVHRRIRFSRATDRRRLLCRVDDVVCCHGIDGRRHRRHRINTNISRYRRAGIPRRIRCCR